MPQLATGLLGDAIASNLFMLGYAWQHGLVPLSHAALMRAIELNGAAIAMNQQAFAWGRLAAINLPAVRRAAGLADTDAPAHLRGDTRKRVAEAAGKSTTLAVRARRMRWRKPMPARCMATSLHRPIRSTTSSWRTRWTTPSRVASRS